MEDEEEELDAGGGIREALLLGGEGVRTRTSTTFKPINADDAADVEASRLPILAAPESGDSERPATPSSRVAAAPVLGGDVDLEALIRPHSRLKTSMMMWMMQMV